MLEEKREKFKGISQATGGFFSKLGLSPNQYTAISLFFVIVSFFFLIRADFLLALIFFFLAAILDFIDGAVARFTQKETKKGAYLDTIADRYVEGIILLGFLFLPLADFFLPAEVWIFFCLLGSLMTTYAKAAAGEKNLIQGKIKNGLVGRAERIILIILALLLGLMNFSWIIYPLIILAVLSNVTAFQRIYLNLHPGQG